MIPRNAMRIVPLAVLFGVVALASQAGAQHRHLPLRGLPNAVASGDVTSDSAVLWARASDPGFLLFQIFARNGARRFPRIAWTHVGDPLVPGKVRFAGLRPGTRYAYRAIAISRGSRGWWRPRVRISATGTFRTPAQPGTRTGLRFGVSGDQRGELAPYPSIINARERGLSFFVELGDTIYADFPSPDLPIPQATTIDEFRIKHQEVYAERFGLNTLAELRFPFTTESFINETPLFLTGLQAFHEYNPIAEEFYGNTGDPRTASKARLYRSRRYGDDAAIFVLDARSFRDPGLPNVQDPTSLAEIAAFLTGSFDPSRTMLGAVQLADLKNDLLQAQLGGVTWKFVMVPEPIQNLGVILASDRFEGYAAERAELLSFIELNGIQNVVFVTADLHGTVINNLSYQTMPFGPQIAVDAFEVITGPVAFDAPLGPEVINLVAALGLISPLELAFYDSLSREGKDGFLQTLIDAQVGPLGYDPVGLDGSSIDATLTQGSYVAAHVYGWTEFAIDADTQALTVTTWGIDAYTEADLADPGQVVGRVPTIVSQFVVRPK